MASLWKRKGVYYARYYVGGKQRSLSLNTASHQAAKEKLVCGGQEMQRVAAKKCSTRWRHCVAIDVGCQDVSGVFFPLFPPPGEGGFSGFSRRSFRARFFASLRR